MAEILLKDGERVNQLFSTDVKIIQNREVFSYSVDSVLLSRFPNLPKRGLIVLEMVPLGFLQAPELRLKS